MSEKKNQFLLLKSRRFLPLFITQFLGAFHDNVFKNALIVLFLYGTITQSDMDPKLLTTIAAGIFIVPFVLFSALSGDLSDKYPKHKIIRIIKLAEIGIAVMGLASLLSGSLALSFGTLFALGTHSAFFGPSKYSILPQHLKPDELIGGNALLNTGTFLAILTGTIAGTFLTLLPHGTTIIGVGLIAVAIAGYWSSRQIPEAPAVAPNLSFNFNIPVQTWRVLKTAFTSSRRVVLCILGVSWFYFMGGMFMAQFPNFTEETLHANQHVLTFFLVVFSIGIAFGGLLNNRLLKGRIEGLYVPVAALAMTIFSLDLYYAAGGLPDRYTLMTITEFLAYQPHWRIVSDIALLAISGGVFVVPLNAIIQHETKEEMRARIQAGNAICNALFMVASALVAGYLITRGWSVRDLFAAFAAANAVVAVYICRLLPEYLFKSVLQGLFKIFYRVEVRGLENYAKAGPRAVIVGNHVSLLDPPLLAAFLPGRPMFAVNTRVAKWWFVAPFLKLVDAFPLDPTNPFSMKALIRKVEEDRHVVIFPEGRLTETGALMKVYDGPGMIADKANATIVPVRLDGVEHTPFARLLGKVARQRFPKIIITILEPRQFKIDPSITGRARRNAAGSQLYNVMETMMFMTGEREQTLYQSLLNTAKDYGRKTIIVEDVEQNPMRFGDLLNGSIALGRKICAITGKGDAVGVMLPNTNAAVVTFFALQAIGRVPAMLNFSTGPAIMVSACTTAKVKTVITSRRFVEMGRLENAIAELEKVTKVVYLEDLRARISKWDRIDTLLTSAQDFHNNHQVRANDPGVILFTSGSEGTPKAVVLSHTNIRSNIVQLTSRVDFNRQDIVFNCLPMFHSFGLVGGTLLPVLCGVRTFLYPSPLHYRIVPEMVYATNATIMFATDTFLNGYARMANPYDFYRMRYIFAGAERVRDETRALYADRFGVQILEGYGATETSPVISVNSKMHRKAGTVGRILPGMEYRLEKVPGVDAGGRLFVKGPNVMLGYYKADNPGVLQPPEDGWYDTGDIVSVDDQGYVKILGRAKRFAKIAGEMVSLTQVEGMAEKIWPDQQHAVVALPDPRKGEQLVLVTTRADAARDQLQAYATKNGITNLAVPGTIIVVAKMPVLGTGKTDYQGVKDLAEKNNVKSAAA